MNDIKIKVKKAMVNNIYGYIDTDIAYAERKKKISSVYGVSCRDNRILTKINKRYGIARGVKKMDRQELIESLKCIEDCISDKSSENEKITVLEDLKPSSLSFILDEVIGYIEMW